jgi:hypothetical protein
MRAKGKAVKKSLTKKLPARKSAKKVSARRPGRSYNSQTGEPTGREIKANVRLEALTKELMNAGEDAATARTKARAIMRDNPRKDWRNG